MSSQYFKVKMGYDTNGGFCNEAVFYVYEDNSIDYRIVVDENGESPSLSGTDSYCDMLAKVLSLEDYPDDYGEHVIFVQVPFVNLPKIVQNVFERKN